MFTTTLVDAYFCVYENIYFKYRVMHVFFNTEVYTCILFHSYRRMHINCMFPNKYMKGTYLCYKINEN